jgi:AcrR family transcriptional regulator
MVPVAPSAPQGPESRQRATLVNARSRDTRQSLVAAALRLWAEGEFEAVYDRTTPADIAREAGVSKGTFYFHFANKEDLLREVLSGNARAMIGDVEAGVSSGVPLFPLAGQVLAAMAVRVARVPKAAALRAGAVSLRARLSKTTLTIPRGTLPAFEALVRHGVDRGELSPQTDVEDAAEMLHLVTLDVMMQWGIEDQSAAWLRHKLQARTEVILRGLSAAAPSGE